MNKKIITVLLILILISTGCGKNNSKDKDRINTSQELYDSSRINKDEVYTLENSVDKFSFVLTHYDYPSETGEFNVPTVKDIIYTYTGNNDKVSFSRYEFGYYEFKYNISEDNSLYNLKVKTSSFDKNNYRQKIEEVDNLVILKEDENYVLYADSNDYGTNYYLIKFFDDNKGVEVEYWDSNIYNRGHEEIYPYMKAVIDTIEKDKGEALLLDKIASITNFKKNKVINYKYVTTIDPYRSVIILTNGNDTLTISYTTGYYSQDGWEVLSNEPYITFNLEQKVYKVVVNGLPEYYKYAYYMDNSQAEYADGTLQGLNEALQKFYK